MLSIRNAQLIEGDVARTWIVDVRRNRSGFRLWAERSRHKTGSFRRTKFIASQTRDTCGLKVEFIREFGQIVIALRNRRRTKRIGFDDICASSQIALMHFADHVWAGERQELVVAFYVFAMLSKSWATKICLRQFVALNHRAHRAVQNHHALAQEPSKVGTTGIAFNRIGQLGIGHESLA